MTFISHARNTYRRLQIDLRVVTVASYVYVTSHNYVMDLLQ